MNTIQLQMDGSVYTAFGNYAAARKTTVQQLLMNYINQLMVAESNETQTVPPIVSRLCGCATNTLDDSDLNGREAYYEHLIEKHQ